MPKPKKRPSKAAKAAQKILSDSKLLADSKAAELNAKSEFRSSVVGPRENTLAIKPRPHKKRG